jgi:hypothetical protein
VQGQPGLHSQTASQKNKNKKQVYLKLGIVAQVLKFQHSGD